ncbi:MAG: 50S ribosomal protein L17 [candidate division WOR-3 bacterium]
MRHGFTKKLGRTKSHRTALLKNLVRQLFMHERIQTTHAKAKLAQRLAERLIRFAKKNTVSARRQVARTIPDRTLLRKLFDVIGPRFADRTGGCTRILRLGPREGDGAEVALLELVVREETHKEKQVRAETKKGPARKKEKKPVKEARPEKRGKADSGKT